MNRRLSLVLFLLLTLFPFLLFSQISKSDLQSPLNLKQISRTDKLYGLSNYWQAVNNNFVYINKIDREKWDQSYKNLLGKVDSLDDMGYYRGLQKLSAMLNDGHSQVYLPEYLQKQMVRGEFVDFKCYTDLVEGKVVVARISDSKKDLLPIGTEILEVNGIPVQRYIDENIKLYLSESSPHVKTKKAAQMIFNDIKNTHYFVKFKKPKGKVDHINLTLSPSANNVLYPIFPKAETFSSKWLSNGVFYIKMLSFEKSSIYNDFLAIMPELKKAKGLILDIRYNGGGSSAVSRNIAQHLIADSLIYGAKNQSRLIIPADKALGSFLVAKDTVEGKKEWGLNRAQTLMYYNSAQGQLFHTYPFTPNKIKENIEKVIVPTLILTESNTASAAEDFLIYLDNQPHIRRIGEPTNGSTGQPLSVNLPNGGEAWICTKKVTFADGREFIGKGIQPAISAPYTLNDLINVQDSALQLAQKELNRKLNSK